MLGTIDQRHLVRLLDALATGDAKGVLAVADELAIRGLSYAGALADLAVLLARGDRERVTGVTPAEDRWPPISRGWRRPCIRTPSSCSIPSPCTAAAS